MYSRILKYLVMAGLLFAILWLAYTERLSRNSGVVAMVGNGQNADTVQAGSKLDKIIKSDQEWRRELLSMQYKILRQKGTEIAFTGKYYKNHEKGIYLCAGCGNELFSSDDKYDSGSGWPSFTAPIEPGKIEEHADSSLWMVRTEVVCSRCQGHLGHVFDDGPPPTGLRYCINSAALTFAPKDSTN